MASTMIIKIQRAIPWKSMPFQSNGSSKMKMEKV